MIQMKGKGSASTSINNISTDQNDNSYKKNAIDGDREYDLCLVLKNKSVEEKCVFNIITKKLDEAGLKLYIYPSALHYDEDKKTRHLEEVHATFHRDTLTFDKDSQFNEDTLIFILIRATVQKLKEFADECDFKMLLDAQILKDACAKGVAPNIKPFSIPYPRKFGDDVFLSSAIPPEQGCCITPCKNYKRQLSDSQLDLVPYQNMYGRFDSKTDENFPGIYINSALPHSDNSTLTEEESMAGRDPFGEEQRLKLTAMMFQKVIKSILRQGAVGTRAIHKKLGINPSNFGDNKFINVLKKNTSTMKDILPDEDYIDTAISEVEVSVPNMRYEKQDDRLDRRALIIDSIKLQLTQFYALHHREKVEHLTKIWLDKWSVMPWNQPFHEIRNYFGEKIAFYFVFVGHYCTWLIIPVIIGIPLQFSVWAVILERKTNGQDDVTNDNSPYSNYFTPVFSFFIALWAVFMLEFWKRKEKSVAIEWGTVGCEDEEPDRPTFRGEYVTSFIDGREGYQYYPARKRSKHVSAAYLIITFCMMCVFAIVGSIYYVQYVTRTSTFANCGGDDDAVRTKCFGNAQYVASILNAVQIQFTNVIFTTVAWKFTEKENNRTDTIFQDSLTIKIFIFQFVNSFASFYYLAFFAQFLGGCTPAKTVNDCMEPLATNIGIIYVIRIGSSIVFDIVMPYMQHAKKSLRSPEELKMLSGPEFEYEMAPYDTIDQSIKDYSSVALHFGYIALFISALPFAGFLGFISAVIEIKNSAWKLLSVYRRPVPISAEDIGAWQQIFLIITIAAVATNAGITCFTMTVLNGVSQNDAIVLKVKLWTFIVFQWVCYVTQAIIMELIPDIPEAAIYHLERNEFLSLKVIDRAEDDDDHEDENSEDLKPSRNSNFSVEIQDNPSSFYKRESLYQPKKHPFVSLFYTEKKAT